MSRDLRFNSSYHQLFLTTTALVGSESVDQEKEKVLTLAELPNAARNIKQRKRTNKSSRKDHVQALTKLEAVGLDPSKLRTKQEKVL